MKVAVCLLTCDRKHYTKRTLRTFAKHNAGDPNLILLHADDASRSRANLVLAEAHGFRTIVRNTKRVGWLGTRIELFDLASRQAEWIFFLENDIETLRPFPWAMFAYMIARHRNAYCLRLYGQFKDRDQQDRCLDTHKRYGHRPVRWMPLPQAPEAAQIGRIHWSAQPCVTRANELLRLHRDGTEPSGLTMRVLNNVTSHFGVSRTVPERKRARVA